MQLVKNSSEVLLEEFQLLNAIGDLVKGVVQSIGFVDHFVEGIVFGFDKCGIVFG